MLLAEANQWPEDAVAYFGDGDECHMAFHFPLMPRLFMAIHMEDRFPIVDILDQTPAIPANCQWAMFLRNHDELTLEMVTDEERDYMYRAYAGDPRARINLGIRRRLAPLLGNNRRRIELMNGLLFSLPGTPVIYYGDEIGMGDNIYLGDRNGVRTPMQWSADRNAGFSRANPQKLFLPVIIDPEYHYEAINVEAQQNNPNSLLWWMKRLIDTPQALARPSAAARSSSCSPRTARSWRSSASTRTRPCWSSPTCRGSCSTSSWTWPHTPARRRSRCSAARRFPPIGKQPFFLTLAPHSFLWFHLLPQPQRAAVVTAWPRRRRSCRCSSARIVARRGPPRRRRLGAGAGRVLLSLARVPGDHERENRADPRLAPASGRRPRAPQLVLLDADLLSGEIERHSLPLLLATDGQRRRNRLPATGGQPPIARTTGGQSGLLYEATLDAAITPRPCSSSSPTSGGCRRRSGAELAGWRAAEFAAIAMRSRRPSHVKDRPTNVSFNSANRLLLKVFREIEEGCIPKIEFGRFFSRSGRSVPVARLLGAVEIAGPPRPGRWRWPCCTSIVQSEGDAWHYTQDVAGRLFRAGRDARAAFQAPPPPDWRKGHAAAMLPPGDLLEGS